MNMLQEHVYKTFEDNSEELKQFEEAVSPNDLKSLQTSPINRHV